MRMSSQRTQFDVQNAIHKNDDKLYVGDYWNGVVVDR